MTCPIREDISVFLIVLMPFGAVSLASLVMSSMLHGVVDVLRPCTVPQVIRLIIIRVAVRVMTNLLPFRSRAMESLGNEYMYPMVLMPGFSFFIAKAY